MANFSVYLQIQYKSICMESIKEIFRIGTGPSSSHTMGPAKAAYQFRKNYPKADYYKVTLYGSLAATGKGHMTDKAVIDVLYPVKTEIIWEPDTFLPQHPNGMKFSAFNSRFVELGNWTVFSTGGGKITDFSGVSEPERIYIHTKMNDLLKFLDEQGRTIWEYVEDTEGSDIYEYLAEVWKTMKSAVKRGIEQEGTLPGGLKLGRKASSYFMRARSFTGIQKNRTLTFSYALAVSEENAACGTIVTAPTCGSCGVLPAVLKVIADSYNIPDKRILRAIATAGLIGNFVKENASISGAEVGCQGEVGTACAMAAGAAAQLLGGTPQQIEYAAEMGMEHHLGLTCDPIAGLVQVPCIERNAFAAERALNCATYAMLSDGRHLVSFDKIVKTMKQTGVDMPSIYRETSEGGLAIMGD